MPRTWVAEAIRQIERDAQRSADTHLIRLHLPQLRGVALYLKDEATHPTGSLKHRLARSLFLYALCNGWIDEGTTIIEASSGSTAVSEAYFAQMLGLPFVAVVPANTSAAKLEQIAFYGGRCHFVPRAADMDPTARELAAACQGHYMDQFTYAERATDWRGNNNIAESIFEQMRAEPHPVPRWIVVGAGTGGTSATIGRFVRYRGYATQLCVVDPEHSAFFDHFHEHDHRDEGQSSRIEGIGRPRPELSFLREVVDHMLRVPDAASLAAMRVLAGLVGRRYGGSTGTNFYGALQLAAALVTAGEQGSIVTLACDPGDRYLNTYYDDAWVAAQGYELQPHIGRLEACLATGRWPAAD